MYTNNEDWERVLVGEMMADDSFCGIIMEIPIRAMRLVLYSFMVIGSPPMLLDTNQGLILHAPLNELGV